MKRNNKDKLLVTDWKSVIYYVSVDINGAYKNWLKSGNLAFHFFFLLINSSF